MKNTRIFYNKITDVAYINNNNFIRETSNQLRNYKILNLEKTQYL